MLHVAKRDNNSQNTHVASVPVRFLIFDFMLDHQQKEMFQMYYSVQFKQMRPLVYD